MKLKIELEIEVKGDCSFKEAQDFFRYEFAGYSLSDWEKGYTGHTIIKWI